MNARRNFVTWVRDSLRSGCTIKVVNVQFNTHIFSIDCTETVRELVKNYYGRPGHLGFLRCTVKSSTA